MGTIEYSNLTLIKTSNFLLTIFIYIKKKEGVYLILLANNCLLCGDTQGIGDSENHRRKRLKSHTYAHKNFMSQRPSDILNVQIVYGME